MNKILKRDEYISMVLNPMMEEKKYEDLKMVNEGLLKNLFGMIKNMFKKDWDTIKGDPTIIRAYKEMDDQLTGFSTMKLSKKTECNQVRQALVDFACDWYDYKMNRAKENDSDPKPAKSMKFKDETLRENMEACEKKINDVVKDDEQMKKWADTLLTDMKTVINKSILEDIKDEEVKKELEKQFNEDLKDSQKVNKMMEEWQNEQLKDVQDERNKFITDAGADPRAIKEDILGDKAIQNICGEFDKFRKVKGDERINLLKKDKMFGFSKLFSDDDYTTDNYKISYKLMDSFYTSLNGTVDGKKISEKFEDTPGPSVQAMCIAVNSFIKNCVFGGDDYGDELPLMAKCAIISNGLISYNLPLNGKDGDEAGNYFTDIANMIANKKFTDVKGKEIKYPKDFDDNAKTLLNKIVTEAGKLKEEGDKKYNEQLKKLNLEK